jgi:hypothetical protein
LIQEIADRVFNAPIPIVFNMEDGITQVFANDDAAGHQFPQTVSQHSGISMVFS